MQVSDLFGEDRETAPALSEPGHGGARPGAGRPKGALSRVNQDLREYLVRLTGREAIVQQWRLASIDPLSPDVHKLARFWGCTPLEAVDRIGAAFARVKDNAYPRLGSIELKAPGAPRAGDGFLGYLLGDEPGDEPSGAVTILDLPYDEIPAGCEVIEAVEMRGAHGAELNDGAAGDAEGDGSGEETP